jgi:N-methylhydantoinase B
MHISGSGIRYTPAEVLEARFPFTVRKFELAADSGGAGENRGGLGLDVHYEMNVDTYCTAIMERSKTPPWGLFGGGSARANLMRVRLPNGQVSDYSKATALPLPKGTVIELYTGGGGGYGAPDQRAIARIKTDLVEGYLSDESARSSYPDAAAGLAEAGETG